MAALGQISNGPTASLSIPNRTRKEIRRTRYVRETVLHDVGVHHGRLHVLVPEQLLNGTDVVPCFQQVRGKGVSKGMTAHEFGNAGSLNRSLDGALNGLLMDVIAHRASRVGIGATIRRGEDKLPGG